VFVGYKFELRERAYQFSVKLIKCLRPLFSDKVYRTILNQPIRSATSISANVCEAKYSGTEKEYARYFEIALKSGNETMHWLRLISDTAESEVKGMEELKKDLEEILKVIAASLISLRRKQKK